MRERVFIGDMFHIMFPIPLSSSPYKNSSFFLKKCKLYSEYLIFVQLKPFFCIVHFWVNPSLGQVLNEIFFLGWEKSTFSFVSVIRAERGGGQRLGDMYDVPYNVEVFKRKHFYTVSIPSAVSMFDLPGAARAGFWLLQQISGTTINPENVYIFNSIIIYSTFCTNCTILHCTALLCTYLFCTVLHCNFL